MLKAKSNHHTRIISIAVAVALLAGCKTVGPDYQRPDVKVPAQYSEVTGENSSNISRLQDANTQVSDPQVLTTWWTLYQDPILNDLVTKARQNNTDIQLAVARIDVYKRQGN